MTTIGCADNSAYLILTIIMAQEHSDAHGKCYTIYKKTVFKLQKGKKGRLKALQGQLLLFSKDLYLY